MGKGSVVPSPEGHARLVCCSSEGTSNARTNDDLLSILSEDPPGETVTLVVGKTNPTTLLSLDDEGKLRSGSEESILL